MRHVLIVAVALFLVVVVGACKTDAPASSTCITSFDCDQSQGYECIDGQCVKTSVVVDTDTKEGDVTPDESTDSVLPDETTDESEEGDGIIADEDGLPDILPDGDLDVPTEGDLPDGTDTPVVDDGVVTETDTPTVDDGVVTETDTPLPDADVEAVSVCDGVTCGGHGNCKVVGGVADCTCYQGYQDNDNDNICLPQCTYSGLDCAANHAYCDDTTGTPHCVCNGGYQDNDLNNTCTANCTTAALTCTGGTCSDTNGTAHCTCTDVNYQDKDNNGTCLPTCAKAVTEGLNCGTHGSCVDTSGTAVCVCNEGYTGTGCVNCATNFHLNGGVCVADEACLANYCNDPKGTCSTPAGVPVCSCATGYAGTTCLDCAGGYQDNDLNGTCEEECTSTCDQSGGIFPESHGSCQYPDGVATCVCDQGWENSWEGISSFECNMFPTLCQPSSFNPECSSCKKNDPPAEYQTYGCPADCTDDPVVTCTGDCYYDKVSGDKYCVP